jgi:hypothetical protein
MMIGTADMRSDSATAGSKPLINPSMTLGRRLIHLRKKTFSVRNLILEIIPMNAAGMDQKITMDAMKA